MSEFIAEDLHKTISEPSLPTIEEGTRRWVIEGRKENKKICEGSALISEDSDRIRKSPRHVFVRQNEIRRHKKPICSSPDGTCGEPSCYDNRKGRVGYHPSSRRSKTLSFSKSSKHSKRERSRSLSVSSSQLRRTRLCTENDNSRRHRIRSTTAKADLRLHHVEEELRLGRRPMVSHCSDQGVKVQKYRRHGDSCCHTRSRSPPRESRYHERGHCASSPSRDARRFSHRKSIHSRTCEEDHRTPSPRHVSQRSSPCKSADSRIRAEGHISHISSSRSHKSNNSRGSPEVRRCHTMEREPFQKHRRTSPTRQDHFSREFKALQVSTATTTPWHSPPERNDEDACCRKISHRRGRHRKPCRSLSPLTDRCKSPDSSGTSSQMRSMITLPLFTPDPSMASSVHTVFNVSRLSKLSKRSSKTLARGSCRESNTPSWKSCPSSSPCRIEEMKNRRSKSPEATPCVNCPREECQCIARRITVKKCRIIGSEVLMPEESDEPPIHSKCKSTLVEVEPTLEADEGPAEQSIEDNPGFPTKVRSESIKEVHLKEVKKRESLKPLSQELRVTGSILRDPSAPHSDHRVSVDFMPMTETIDESDSLLPNPQDVKPCENCPGGHCNCDAHRARKQFIVEELRRIMKDLKCNCMDDSTCTSEDCLSKVLGELNNLSVSKPQVCPEESLFTPSIVDSEVSPTFSCDSKSPSSPERAVSAASSNKKVSVAKLSTDQSMTARPSAAKSTTSAKSDRHSPLKRASSAKSAQLTNADSEVSPTFSCDSKSPSSPERAVSAASSNKKVSVAKLSTDQSMTARPSAAKSTTSAKSDRHSPLKRASSAKSAQLTNAESVATRVLSPRQSTSRSPTVKQGSVDTIVKYIEDTHETTPRSVDTNMSEVVGVPHDLTPYYTKRSRTDSAIENEGEVEAVRQEDEELQPPETATDGEEEVMDTEVVEDSKSRVSKTKSVDSKSKSMSPSSKSVESKRSDGSKSKSKSVASTTKSVDSKTKSSVDSNDKSESMKSKSPSTISMRSAVSPLSANSGKSSGGSRSGKRSTEGNKSEGLLSPRKSSPSGSATESGGALVDIYPPNERSDDVDVAESEFIGSSEHDHEPSPSQPSRDDEGSEALKTSSRDRGSKNEQPRSKSRSAVSSQYDRKSKMSKTSSGIPGGEVENARSKSRSGVPSQVDLTSGTAKTRSRSPESEISLTRSESRSDANSQCDRKSKASRTRSRSPESEISLTRSESRSDAHSQCDRKSKASRTRSRSPESEISLTRSKSRSDENSQCDRKSKASRTRSRSPESEISLTRSNSRSDVHSRCDRKSKASRSDVGAAGSESKSELDLQHSPSEPCQDDEGPETSELSSREPESESEPPRSKSRSGVSLQYDRKSKTSKTSSRIRDGENEASRSKSRSGVPSEVGQTSGAAKSQSPEEESLVSRCQSRSEMPSQVDLTTPTRSSEGESSIPRPKSRSAVPSQCDRKSKTSATSSRIRDGENEASRSKSRSGVPSEVSQTSGAAKSPTRSSEGESSIPRPKSRSAVPSQCDRKSKTSATPSRIPDEEVGTARSKSRSGVPSQVDRTSGTPKKSSPEEEISHPRSKSSSGVPSQVDRTSKTSKTLSRTPDGENSLPRSKTRSGVRSQLDLTSKTSKTPSRSPEKQSAQRSKSRSGVAGSGISNAPDSDDKSPLKQLSQDDQKRTASRSSSRSPRSSPSRSEPGTMLYKPSPQRSQPPPEPGVFDSKGKKSFQQSVDRLSASLSAGEKSDYDDHTIKSDGSAATHISSSSRYRPKRSRSPSVVKTGSVATMMSRYNRSEGPSPESRRESKLSRKADQDTTDESVEGLSRPVNQPSESSEEECEPVETEPREPSRSDTNSRSNPQSSEEECEEQPSPPNGNRILETECEESEQILISPSASIAGDDSLFKAEEGYRESVPFVHLSPQHSIQEDESSVSRDDSPTGLGIRDPTSRLRVDVLTSNDHSVQSRQLSQPAVSSRESRSASRDRLISPNSNDEVRDIDRRYSTGFTIGESEMNESASTSTSGSGSRGRSDSGADSTGGKSIQESERSSRSHTQSREKIKTIKEGDRSIRSHTQSREKIKSLQEIDLSTRSHTQSREKINSIQESESIQESSQTLGQARSRDQISSCCEGEDVIQLSKKPSLKSRQSGTSVAAISENTPGTPEDSRPYIESREPEASSSQGRKQSVAQPPYLESSESESIPLPHRPPQLDCRKSESSPDRASLSADCDCRKCIGTTTCHCCGSCPCSNRRKPEDIPGWVVCDLYNTPIIPMGESERQQSPMRAYSSTKNSNISRLSSNEPSLPKVKGSSSTVASSSAFMRSQSSNPNINQENKTNQDPRGDTSGRSRSESIADAVASVISNRRKSTINHHSEGELTDRTSQDRIKGSRTRNKSRISLSPIPSRSITAIEDESTPYRDEKDNNPKKGGKSRSKSSSPPRQSTTADDLCQRWEAPMWHRRSHLTVSELEDRMRASRSKSPTLRHSGSSGQLTKLRRRTQSQARFQSSEKEMYQDQSPSLNRRSSLAERPSQVQGRQRSATDEQAVNEDSPESDGVRIQLRKPSRAQSRSRLSIHQSKTICLDRDQLQNETRNEESPNADQRLMSQTSSRHSRPSNVQPTSETNGKRNIESGDDDSNGRDSSRQFVRRSKLRRSEDGRPRLASRPSQARDQRQEENGTKRKPSPCLDRSSPLNQSPRQSMAHSPSQPLKRSPSQLRSPSQAKSHGGRTSAGRRKSKWDDQDRGLSQARSIVSNPVQDPDPKESRRSKGRASEYRLETDLHQKAPSSIPSNEDRRETREGKVGEDHIATDPIQKSPSPKSAKEGVTEELSRMKSETTQTTLSARPETRQSYTSDECWVANDEDITKPAYAMYALPSPFSERPCTRRRGYDSDHQCRSMSPPDLYADRPESYSPRYRYSSCVSSESLDGRDSYIDPYAHQDLRRRESSCSTILSDDADWNMVAVRPAVYKIRGGSRCYQTGPARRSRARYKYPRREEDRRQKSEGSSTTTNTLKTPSRVIRIRKSWRKLQERTSSRPRFPSMGSPSSVSGGSDIYSSISCLNTTMGILSDNTSLVTMPPLDNDDDYYETISVESLPRTPLDVIDSVTSLPRAPLDVLASTSKMNVAAKSDDGLKRNRIDDEQNEQDTRQKSEMSEIMQKDDNNPWTPKKQQKTELALLQSVPGSPSETRRSPSGASHQSQTRLRKDPSVQRSVMSNYGGNTVTNIHTKKYECGCQEIVREYTTTIDGGCGKEACPCGCAGTQVMETDLSHVPSPPPPVASTTSEYVVRSSSRSPEGITTIQSKSGSICYCDNQAPVLHCPDEKPCDCNFNCDCPQQWQAILDPDYSKPKSMAHPTMQGSGVILHCPDEKPCDCNFPCDCEDVWRKASAREPQVIMETSRTVESKTVLNPNYSKLHCPDEKACDCPYKCDCETKWPEMKGIMCPVDKECDCSPCGPGETCDGTRSCDCIAWDEEPVHKDTQTSTTRVVKVIRSDESEQPYTSEEPSSYSEVKPVFDKSPDEGSTTCRLYPYGPPRPVTESTTTSCITTSESECEPGCCKKFFCCMCGAGKKKKKTKTKKEKKKKPPSSKSSKASKSTKSSKKSKSSKKTKVCKEKKPKKEKKKKEKTPKKKKEKKEKKPKAPKKKKEKKEKKPKCHKPKKEKKPKAKVKKCAKNCPADCTP